ncbi:MAG: signal peptidase I [Lachnospiraceae bacterium]|nr:signal peptidase I [Lachnospiraceae bacterium]MBD5456625.1 signal peptidase I [Lachnospiraceae bacterium]
MKKRRFLKKYDGLKYGWLNNIKKFLLLLIVLLFIFHSVIGFSFIKGYSMQPTLMEGDLVLYIRFNLSYQRGDIVSVKIPSGEYYVKRIIAMEGDTVDLKDGKVYVNDELISEPYLNVQLTEPDGGIVRYPYTLQKGQVFIMGDNRSESMDSRNFGAVGKRQIKGKILFRISRTF